MQKIPTDIYDYPVCEEYISFMKEKEIEVAYASRWLNAVLIYHSPIDSGIQWLKDQSYVEKITYLGSRGEVVSHHFTKNVRSANHPDKAMKQLEKMYAAIGLHHLHMDGYTGEGINVAVIDAGFPGVDRLKAFKMDGDSLSWIKGSRDFFPGQNNYQRGMGHGTSVLSVMKGRITDGFFGAAPGANYWLLATENEYAEEPIEEFLLVQALEFADSAGVSVVNVSLGYHTFDQQEFSYKYHQLNGSTSISSKAAAIAAKKGMLVVNSAGNDGKDKWKYVGFPADAEGVLSVGAVKMNGKPARFSSRQSPVAKHQTPRIAAPGVGFPVIFPNGMIFFGDGTSYASPLMAAAAACLWQQFPQATSAEIIHAIEQSGNQKEQPGKRTGFGIPDMLKARQILMEKYLPNPSLMEGNIMPAPPKWSEE
jgi:subtilisin family serine protease